MQRGTAAALVRSSATPSLSANQPHAFEHPYLFDSDVQPRKSLTPKQEAALSELLCFDKEKIIAWLTVLRSIETLSKQQLDALSTLKDCDDGEISSWLNLSHLESQ